MSTSDDYKFGFADTSQIYFQTASAPDQPPSYNESKTYAATYADDATQLDSNTLFQQIKAKYEISKEFSDKLQLLQGFKIVFIFDDSGSMNTVLQDSPLNQPNSLKATRWDELRYFANISIEIASLFDPTGCDIYFLNRPSIKNLKLDNLNEFLGTFTSTVPNGYTPLTKRLNEVLNDNLNLVKSERKLLIIIVTDGEPTTDEGNVDIRQFKRSLKSRHPIERIFTTIVACTDDDASISYLNKWDRELKHLDVVDDFRNEREEIRKVRGQRYRFSYGDYVVKSLVGSVDPTLDELDENGDCCVLL